MYTGVGSDIGGSLRMPANFSGCIAYKPSSRRSPQTGKGLIDRDTYANKFGIIASQGPLAMNMNDIIRFMKVLWDNNNGNKIDPYMAPIPFRNNIFLSKKKLKIGYWKIDDGWFTSSKCVQRAISEVVNNVHYPLQKLNIEMCIIHYKQRHQDIMILYVMLVDVVMVEMDKQI